MSQNQSGESTRRTFLGTAAAATAATAVNMVASPTAGARDVVGAPVADQIKVAQLSTGANDAGKPVAATADWTQPAAMAIPKGGYFELQQGRYGPIFPRTPACYGFSVFAKVIPGREQAFYDHAKIMEKAVKENPHVLDVLKLHYAKWLLIPVKDEIYMMYQAIFDTDFDKYTEDAVAIFNSTGISTVFTNLEGWPTDWRQNPAACVKFFRDHHCPSFLEIGEYPYVSAAEVKKGLRIKAALGSMLDQMQ